MNKYLRYGITVVVVGVAAYISYRIIKPMLANKGVGVSTGKDEYNVMAKINVFIYKTPAYGGVSDRYDELYHQGDKVGTVLKADYDAATDETWLKVTIKEGTGYVQKKSLQTY